MKKSTIFASIVLIIATGCSNWHEKSLTQYGNWDYVPPIPNYPSFKPSWDGIELTAPFKVSNIRPISLEDL